MTYSLSMGKHGLAQPSARTFAAMSGLESLTRALVAAALPIQTQALFGNDESVSVLFLAGSCSAFAMAFLIPKLSVLIGRTRLCLFALTLIAISAGLFMLQLIPAQILGFIVRAIGSAAFVALLSMFILDNVQRKNFSRAEPLRFLFIGLAWTFGPIVGVLLAQIWGEWAPFFASGVIAVALLGYFGMLRFRNLPLIDTEIPKARGPLLRHVRTFLRRPRLVLAWLLASGRGMFWSTFNIYVPLFAVQTGLGMKAGGVLVGLGSSFILAMPLWGWCARRFGIRVVSIVCFPVAALALLLAGLSTALPWIAAGFLMLATLSMSAIDGYGDVLFLRACKPSQRTTMAPIFSTQRDFAEIGPAAIFAILLTFFPVQVVFFTISLVLAALTFVSLQINKRL